MPTSFDALLSGVAAEYLAVRVLPDDSMPIARVTLVEDLDTAEALLPGALAVFTRSSAERAGGYQLDVMVRRAADSEVAGLVLRRSTRRSITAETLARRGRVALLDVADDVDPAVLLNSLGAAVAGGARESLARLAAASRHRLIGDTNGIVAQMSRLVAVDLRYDPSDSGEFAVDVDGRDRGAVYAHDASDVAVVASRLTAAELSLALTRRAREELLPLRTASIALAQLLLASESKVPAVSARALELGLPVHDWHCVARLALGRGAETEAGALSLDDTEKEVLTLVAEKQREGQGVWTATRPDDSIVIVHSTRSDPRRVAVQALETAMADAAQRLLAARPGGQIRVGVGTARQGSTGLRVSAEEARTALASARLSADLVSIATFDSLGLQRMLAEWLVTDTARTTVGDLLAPLDALGPDKSATYVETLHTYLDERGSLQRAATRLHLHRNAVVYRMAQINKVLDVDLKDPDQRFALQLACRARLMIGT